MVLQRQNPSRVNGLFGLDPGLHNVVVQKHFLCRLDSILGFIILLENRFSVKLQSSYRLYDAFLQDFSAFCYIINSSS